MRKFSLPNRTCPKLSRFVYAAPSSSTYCRAASVIPEIRQLQLTLAGLASIIWNGCHTFEDVDSIPSHPSKTPAFSPFRRTSTLKTSTSQPTGGLLGGELVGCRWSRSSVIGPRSEDACLRCRSTRYGCRWIAETVAEVVCSATDSVELVEIVRGSTSKG